MAGCIWVSARGCPLNKEGNRNASFFPTEQFHRKITDINRTMRADIYLYTQKKKASST